MKILKCDLYIFLILLISLLLRVPGIFDGLPAVYNSTEYFLAKTALNLGAQKSLDPGIYVYPTFFYYILILIFGAYYFIGWLAGIFSDVYSFAIQFLLDPSGLYIVTRFINTLLSLFSIFILYRFLIRNSNKTIARISSFMMVVSYYLIMYANFATADTILICFSLLATIWFYKIYENPTQLNFFLGGLFCGLAVAAKYNAGLLAVGLLLSILLSKRLSSVKRVKSTAIAAAGLGIGFFLPNPLWLIYPQRFYDGFRLISAQMYSAVSAERGTPYLWELLHLIRDELIIGVVFLVATFYYLIKIDRKHIPALTVILLTFLIVGSWTKKGIDYLFAVFPAWVILSGYLIDELSQYIINKKYLRITLLIIIFAPSFIFALYNNILSMSEDTREIATAWIISNVTQDDQICYDNSHYDLGIIDVNRFISYGASAAQLPALIKQRLLKYKNHNRNKHLIPILVSNSDSLVQTDNPYESEALRYRRRSLAELRQMHTDYLITNNWYYHSYLSADMYEYPPGVQIGIKDVQDFYKMLFEKVDPVVIFKPDIWTPGPEIRIYDLRRGKLEAKLNP
jgi:hypothetical protein